MRRFFSVVLVLGLGAAAIAEEASAGREIKAERGELLAASEIQRRRAELNQALKQLDEDANVLIGEIRAHHAIKSSENLSFEKLNQGLLTVTLAPLTSSAAAPVSTK